VLRTLGFARLLRCTSQNFGRLRMTYRRVLYSTKYPDKSKFEVHPGYALSFYPKGFGGSKGRFFQKAPWRVPCRIPTNQNSKKPTKTACAKYGRHIP
jgi:hypothetical protein